MSKTRKFDYERDNFERIPSKNQKQNQKRLQRALRTKSVHDIMALDGDDDYEDIPDYE